MTYRYKAKFEKTLQKLPTKDQSRVVDTVEKIIQFFETRQAPEGLGLKKLFAQHGLGAVFEGRAGLALRILFGVQRDVVTFLMIGNHDEVRRFIRTFQ